jgi:hypothetical protein
MDPSQPPTLERIRQYAPELLALTAAHGGQDLRVFGSVIHGGAGRQSDVIDQDFTFGTTRVDSTSLSHRTTPLFRHPIRKKL